MISRPIVILGIPRSGTSLVCRILSFHGVWFGKCKGPDKENKYGYYENKRFLDLRFCKDYIDKQTVENILLQQGYKSGPWAVKHNPRRWNKWIELDPIWVVVKRKKENCLASLKRLEKFKGVSEERLIRKIELEQEALDSLFIYTFNSKDLFYIHSDILVKKETEDGLINLLKKVNKVIIPSITRFCIDREVWHG